jgi:hypothetical protein
MFQILIMPIMPQQFLTELSDGVSFVVSERLNDSSCLGPKSDGTNHVFTHPETAHGIILVAEELGVSSIAEMLDRLWQPGISANEGFVA